MKKKIALAVLMLSAVVSAEPANVAGKWNASMQLETITGHPVLTFKQDGEKITGTYEGRYGAFDLKGTVKDKKIEFTVTMVAEGSRTQGFFAGTVEGDTIKGTVEFEGAGEGTWTASREAKKQ